MVPDVNLLCPQLLPAISVRIGKIPVAEQSEEVRLLMLQLLSGPIAKRAVNLLSDYLDDLSSILQRAFADSFHDIKKVQL